MVFYVIVVIFLVALHMNKTTRLSSQLYKYIIFHILTYGNKTYVLMLQVATWLMTCISWT